MADTEALTSADLKGALAGGLIRESVMNKIWDISKIPLPFTDLVGTDSVDVKNEYCEWTKDKLAAVDLTNAVGDGWDAVGNDAALGTRVGNHHQISDKVVKVSHRSDASTTIGRAKELGYQLMRRQQELRRDVEGIALSNQESRADAGTDVDGEQGLAGCLPAWIETTVRNGTAGGFNTTTKIVDAATPGSAAALNETWVREVIDSVYSQGGDPSVMMSVPGIIGNFAQYLFTSTAQVATLTSDQGRSREKAAALSAVNVFITQHGTVRLVSNRLQQVYDNGGTDCADVFILDPEYVALTYLEGYRTDALGKTGLSNKRQMSVDWSLVVHNEEAHGIIFGIDPTLDVAA